MKRVCLLVLDAVGVGALPDADKYGDVGANTLGNVIKYANPKLPNMASMGLGNIPNIDYEKSEPIKGAFGRANEASPGKDTTTGHWEMAGIILKEPFPTFPNGFPEKVIQAFEKAINTKTLGNVAASGTKIIELLGKEHINTGYPIVYTSADSVFQIACHEKIWPVEKLYEICEIARNQILTDKYSVGRVIARPFEGSPGEFIRTPRRKDFSVKPFGKTILDEISQNGMETIGIGKIEDIFAMQGITKSVHSAGNEACLNETIKFLKEDFKGLIFVNLVDTDMIFGHRRDAIGFAKSLEQFDNKLGEIKNLIKDEDLLIITADHGCDPTFRGSDHTREYVPILCWNPKLKSGINLGTRESFADIAATISHSLGLQERFGSTSFFEELKLD